MGKQENEFQENLQDFLKTAEKQATLFFETVADTFLGKAETLRDGTELDPVELPRDLAAHRGAQTEWWYYTGHFETAAGKHFGFELVFFKRRTDLDKFSLVPLRFFGNPIYFAHFALTDREDKLFRYAHRKSANGLLDAPAAASEKHFYLRLGDWSVRESHGAHILRATIGKTVFEAALKPRKRAILNGPGGDGVSFKDEGEASRYFSYTRMELEGDLVWEGGEAEHVRGTAWMDREFGTWTPTERQKGWDWFSIQFDNDCELMCYQIRDGKDGVSDFSSGTFVDEHGRATYLSRPDFTVAPTGYWKSPRTGAVYPSGWRVSVPKVDLELVVTPVIEDQELDTRGTTMIVYWEGACEVEGNHSKGRAYVELVGYDRSHDQPNLAYFLMGNSFEFPPKSFFG